MYFSAQRLLTAARLVPVRTRPRAAALSTSCLSTTAGSLTAAATTAHSGGLVALQSSSGIAATNGQARTFAASSAAGPVFGQRPLDASTSPSPNLLTPALAAAFAAALAATGVAVHGDDGSLAACSSEYSGKAVDPADSAEHRQRVDKALGQLKSQFNCSMSVLNNIANRMDKEMSRGLRKTEGSEIKMLPSYVSGVPSGKEEGKFLALDLGGSNFRVVAFGLSPSQGVELLEARKVTIPAELMTSDSDASELFGFIADQVGMAPGAKDKSTPNLKLGFTFSFPVDQKSINEGNLVHWTKGFSTRDCEGEEVVQLLQNAFKERDISVDVSALVNDTVGTLVAHAVEDKRTQVGVILGTGCNACYVEKVGNILKLDDTSGDPDASMVINMEWGGFDSHGVCGASTIYDIQIDREENPGSQRFEKQISGRYLGEIARLVICNLMDSGLLFAGDDVSPMAKEAAERVFRSKHHFTTPMMSAIEANQDAEIRRQLAFSANNKFAEYYSKVSEAEQKIIRDVSVSQKAMQHVIQLSVADSPAAFAKQASMAQAFAELWICAPDRDREIIARVCQMVSTRAARLAAAAVVAVVRKTGHDDATIAIDGSVFEKYPHFKSDMEDAIQEMCGGKRTLRLVHAEDGSGKGAALIAAIASQN